MAAKKVRYCVFARKPRAGEAPSGSCHMTLSNAKKKARELAHRWGQASVYRGRAHGYHASMGLKAPKLQAKFIREDGRVYEV